jgi:hypothetical protein
MALMASMQQRVFLFVVGLLVCGWSHDIHAQADAPPAAPAPPPPTSTPPAPPPSAAPTTTPPDDANDLVEQAETYAEDATEADTASEAEDAADRVHLVADQVAAQGGDKGKKEALDKLEEKARRAVAEKQEIEHEKKKAEESLCSASSDNPQAVKSLCLVFGLFAASLSVVRVEGEGLPSPSGFYSGQSSHHLTSIAVPFAGARWVPLKSVGYVSLDVAAYSAFLTQNLNASTPTGRKEPCSSTATDFASRLPCEANAPVFPYLGAYLGITVGKSGLAYVTLIPFTLGLAQVGTSTALRGYMGWSVGVIQLNGSL